jgi:hypothetical protein
MATNLSQETVRKSAKEQLQEGYEKAKTAVFGAEGTDKTIKPEPEEHFKLHEGYWKANIGRIKETYKKQGIKLPDYFSSAKEYATHMVLQRKDKVYGGRVQPRRASNAGDNQ